LDASDLSQLWLAWRSAPLRRALSCLESPSSRLEAPSIAAGLDRSKRERRASLIEPARIARNRPLAGT
jgi:hypothetical protein